MIIRSLLTVIVMFTIFDFSVTAYAADTSRSKFSAKVKVSVTAEGNIKNRVSSYLNRELRALNDVELVETNPEWEISVIAMELKSVGGTKTGFALSTVILISYDNRLLCSFFEAEYKALEYTAAVVKETSSLYLRPSQWLNIGSTDDLQRICRDVVADFDMKHLEESRKLYRRMPDWLKKY